MSRRDIGPSHDRARHGRYRSPHRQRHHAQLHAEGGEGFPPLLDHPMAPTNEPELVDTDEGLARLVASLREAGSFGYDSEFIGEHSYHPKLCLIQVATPETVTLVDPLAGVDLDPFWRLLADASVEKVLHAGQQDLEPTVRHLGEPPRNVFDTQIAAAFVGLHYPVGLAKLASELLDADLGRGLKFTQWDQRPLSEIQVFYAANDVRYLPLLRQELGGRLDESGNLRWFENESATLSDVELYRFDPTSGRLRGRSAESLSARQRAILRELLTWREQTAREQDIPPRSLLKDGLLTALARSRVKSVSKLRDFRGFPRPVQREYGEAILEAIERGREAPLNRGQRKRPYDRDPHRQRIDAVWARFEKWCETHEIAPLMLTSKAQIAQVVCADEAGHDWPACPATGGWRAEMLTPLLTEWLEEIE